jgi:hypothetical protein
MVATKKLFSVLWGSSWSIFGINVIYEQINIILPFTTITINSQKILCVIPVTHELSTLQRDNS